jgi:hypothetical protein
MRGIVWIAAAGFVTTTRIARRAAGPRRND